MEELNTTQIAEAMPLETELAPEQQFSLLDRAQNFGANIIDNIQTRAENLRTSTKRAIALGGIAIAGIGFAGAELATSASAEADSTSSNSSSSPTTLSISECASAAVQKPIRISAKIHDAGQLENQMSAVEITKKPVPYCDSVVQIIKARVQADENGHWVDKGPWLSLSNDITSTRGGATHYADSKGQVIKCAPGVKKTKLRVVVEPQAKDPQTQDILKKEDYLASAKGGC